MPGNLAKLGSESLIDAGILRFYGCRMPPFVSDGQVIPGRIKDVSNSCVQKEDKNVRNSNGKVGYFECFLRSVRLKMMAWYLSSEGACSGIERIFWENKRACG